MAQFMLNQPQSLQIVQKTMRFVLTMTFNCKKRMSCWMFLHRKSVCYAKIRFCTCILCFVVCWWPLTFWPFCSLLPVLSADVIWSLQEIASELAQSTGNDIMLPHNPKAFNIENKWQKNARRLLYDSSCCQWFISGLVSCKAILLHVAF